MKPEKDASLRVCVNVEQEAVQVRAFRTTWVPHGLFVLSDHVNVDLFVRVLCLSALGSLCGNNIAPWWL